jgi:hypothetical protein
MYSLLQALTLAMRFTRRDSNCFTSIYGELSWKIRDEKWKVKIVETLGYQFVLTNEIIIETKFIAKIFIR